MTGAVWKLKKEYCVEIRLQRTAFLIPHTTCAINAWKILKGLWRMKLTVGNSVYEMNDKQFNGVLKIASKAIPFGIYAVSKKGVAILLKETYSTNEELKKAVSDYAMKGFKVYYNEHGRRN